MMRDPIAIAILLGLFLVGAVIIGAAGELGSEIGLRTLEAQRLPAQTAFP